MDYMLNWKTLYIISRDRLMYLFFSIVADIIYTVSKAQYCTVLSVMEEKGALTTVAEVCVFGNRI